MVGNISKGQCCGCEACYNACNNDAVSMELDDEGFFYPKVNERLCTKCGRCISVCPIIKKKDEIHQNITAYAGRNNNTDVRIKSTSGGIFSVLAEYYINSLNGIVVSASYSDDFKKVYMSEASNISELNSLIGSKYIQARIDKIYCRIRQLLKNGKDVLFVGLPCQVGGLLSFLGVRYSNLFCIDLVCFGVPSPKLWSIYLNEITHGETTQEVRFKDKTFGWKNWSVKILYGNNKIVLDKKTENDYMKSYLYRLNIRPSCFNCNFKGLERESDITISDCWGIGEKNTRLNDDKGLSAIVIRTDKARRLWANISKQITYEEYNPEVLMQGNYAMFKSVAMNEERDAFFANVKESGFSEAIKKYEDKRHE